MANTVRGEVAITLAGQDYALRPTMRFIAEVEDAHGSLIALLRRLHDGTWMVSEVTSVIALALDGDDGLGTDDIADAVHEAGPLPCAEQLTLLLSNALLGERAAEAAVRAAAETADTEGEAAPEASAASA